MAGRTLDAPSSAARSREEEAIEVLGRLEALLAARTARAAQAGQTTPVVAAAFTPHAHDEHLPRIAHVPHWQDVLRAVLPFWLSIATAAVTLVMFEFVARPVSFTLGLVVLVNLAMVHHRSDTHRSLATGALVGVALGLGIALIS